MEQYSERIFVHGSKRARNPRIKMPHEIQYDFDTRTVQTVLDRFEPGQNMAVAEAYAIFEHESDAAEYDAREHQDPSVIIIINRLLLSSPSNNPICQNTWYAFTAEQGGPVRAEYGFEFLQGGRPLLQPPAGLRVEERLARAGRQHEAQHRAVFRDDEPVLRALLDTIGR